MIQQLLAILIILFLLFKLIWQKRNKQIFVNEFIFWLLFWIIALLAVVFIKKIDNIVANLGFSGSGIDVLLYISIVVLFYWVFSMRLKLEKMDRNITKIIREISLKNKQ